MNKRTMPLLALAASLLLAASPAWAQMRRDSPPPPPPRQPLPAPQQTPWQTPWQPPEFDEVMSGEIGGVARTDATPGWIMGFTYQQRPVKPLSAGIIGTLWTIGEKAALTVELDGRAKWLLGSRETVGAVLGLIGGGKAQTLEKDTAAGPSIGLLAGLTVMRTLTLSGRVTYAPLFSDKLSLRTVTDARVGVELHPYGYPILQVSVLGQQIEGPSRHLLYGPTIGAGFNF